MREILLGGLGDKNKIENLIHEIRGRQVMLDSDLARLYGCTNGTKVINQAVRRNIERFPEDFYFQLTEEEVLRSQIVTANIDSKDILKSQLETSSCEDDVILKSQIVTSSTKNWGGARKRPYVFTEQGVAMLATVLRTPVAASVSINIMRAFVAMRKYISSDLIEQKFVNWQVAKNTEDIKLLQESFKKFEEKRKVNEIYFDGQIYDAYSKIQDIFERAKKKLVIIDAYADRLILDIIKRFKKEVIIITRKNNLLTRQDIEKYNKQYFNLRVVFNDTFHDRYFILDDAIVYHCGASINRIGYKTFSITKICDNKVCDALVRNVKGIIK